MAVPTVEGAASQIEAEFLMVGKPDLLDRPVLEYVACSNENALANMKGRPDSLLSRLFCHYECNGRAVPDKLRASPISQSFEFAGGSPIHIF